MNLTASMSTKVLSCMHARTMVNYTLTSPVVASALMVKLEMCDS